MSKLGKFIVFEGLDGAGKSTLICALEKILKNKAIAHIVTQEPGGTELGKEIKQLLLKPRQSSSIMPRAELLLYEAARAQHVDELIRPNLQQGIWVLCDRFNASSIAFQSGGRGIAPLLVETLNDFATGCLEPDLTILLDIEPSEAKHRRALRSKKTGIAQDRIENESNIFYKRVRESFLSQAHKYSKNSKNWLVLDASQPVDTLLAQILSYLKDKQWIN